MEGTRRRAQTGQTRDPPAVAIVVITTDAELLAVLREASAQQYVLSHVKTADAAVDAISQHPYGILIADISVLRGELTALLGRLRGQFPELVILATGRRDEEGTVASLISSGQLYRFLHKPVSPARASLFLTTAARRHGELMDVQSAAMRTVKQFARKGPGRALIGGAIGTLLLSAIAGIWRLQQPTNPADPMPEPTSTTKVDVAGPLQRLLSNAQNAFAAGKLIEPSGDNALEYYQSALALQNKNADALQGIERIGASLAARVTNALEAGGDAQALAELAALQRALPAYPKLKALREQVLANVRTPPSPPATVAAATPQPAAMVLDQPKAEPPVIPDTSTVNIDRARALIRAGRLLEPEGDNALRSLRLAREAGEDKSAIKITAGDLGSRILAGVEQGIAAGDLEQALQASQAAVGLDLEFELALADLAKIDARVRSLIVAANQRAALAQALTNVATLREAGRLIEPAGDNAYEKLAAIIAQRPDDPDARAEQQRLAIALSENARAALAADDLDRAEALARRAELSQPGADTNDLLQQILTLREQRLVIPAAGLPRIREAMPVYPRQAEISGTEGSVDIEFTIAPDGSTRDMVVLDSMPKRTFDAAALEALRKWRFRPIFKNGAPVAQRAAIRIRFTLE